jgi:hypothetical protein
LSRADADRPGKALIDEAHLTVFLTWWQMGGAQSPPTISEVLTWPADLRHDMLHLMQEMGEAQGAARKKRKARTKKP